MPVIPVTWEAQVGGLQSKASPEVMAGRDQETLSEKKKLNQKSLGK
jgi:hypothetical protein